MMLGGELAAKRGGLDEALDVAQQLEAAQDRAIEGAGAWVRAHVDRARGDTESAIAKLVQAAEVIVPGMFRSRLMLQLAELADGEAAVRAAREACELCDRHGNTRVGDRARRRLRELGVRPSTRRAGPSGPLSARELEVARAYAEGLSSAEVGERLSISPHTAATHLQKIYKRLGVASRAELTRWLIEQE
jgi:DNA-binding CsgD family transcriptional regulator